MDGASQRFIDDMGNFFASYGVGHALGRVFGYLLLQPEPVSLDAIAADLEMSKSGASTAARLLDQWSLARRLPDRGSRRIRYEATTAIDRLLLAGLIKLSTFMEAVEEGKRVAAPGPPTERLVELSRALNLYYAAIESALTQLGGGQRP